MNRSRSVVVVVVVALFAAGLAIASLAAGAAKPRKTPRGNHFVRVIGPCGIAPAPTKDDQSPKPAPSKELLAAFGVLRRDRADSDTMPPSVVAELRLRGASFDPATARLLRTTASGGKAWIVPVGDVHVFDARGICGAAFVTRARGGVVYAEPPVAVPAPPRIATTPAPPRPVRPAHRGASLPETTVVTKPVTVRAVRKVLQVPRLAATVKYIRVPRVVYAKRGKVRTLAAAQRVKVLSVLNHQRALLEALRPAVRTSPQVPQEGVAVVSTGDAPAGGGGALDAIVRGRSHPEVRPCAGASHALTSISGVVPDGVAAAFLTSPDGTAIKADVANNAYSFLVAPLSSPATRYVVWLKDGLPHVQALSALPPMIRCAATPTTRGIDITPSGAGFPDLVFPMTRPSTTRLPAVPPLPVPTTPEPPPLPKK